MPDTPATAATGEQHPGAEASALAPPRITIVVQVGPDPNARHGERYARDAGYRLRLLLKIALKTFGFRCVSVTDPT